MKVKNNIPGISFFYFILFPAVFLFLIIAIVFSCSHNNPDRHINVRELSEKVSLVSLTPIESKKFEKIANAYASPCGDDITLAQSLFNLKKCPYAHLAARFLVDAIIDGTNDDEIELRYLQRYAADTVNEIPIDGSPVMGNAKAKVVLVIFTDFKCPFCAKAAKIIDELLTKHKDELAVIFKNFPLKIHQGSSIAAHAAFAAHRQGMFRQMHDELFKNYSKDNFDENSIYFLAQKMEMDVEKFKEDLWSDAAKMAVTADKKLGEKLGVEGTPAIFLNGRMLKNGTRSLPARIKEELLKQK